MLHLSGPRFLFDIHESLQLAKMMCVAKSMHHPGKRKVGLPVIVNHATRQPTGQVTALRLNPVPGQPRRAHHMQPGGPPAHTKAGFVKMFHASPAHADLSQPLDEAPKPLGTAAAHGGQGRRRHLGLEQVGQHLRQPRLGQEMGLVQVDSRGAQARAVLNGRRHPLRKRGGGRCPTASAASGIGTVLGDLQRLRCGEVEDLPDDRASPRRPTAANRRRCTWTVRAPRSRPGRCVGAGCVLDGRSVRRRCGPDFRRRLRVRASLGGFFRPSLDGGLPLF